ncbi:MAG: hypothetical protein ACHQT8_00465 [Chlamydiales bacterium]
MKPVARNICGFLDHAIPYLQNSIVEERELLKLEFFKQEAFSRFHVPGLLFECPLLGGSGSRWVDLGIKIDPASTNVAQSMSYLEKAFSEMATKDIWARCTRFLSNAQLTDKEGYFGIELDIGSGSYPPAPNLFMCTMQFQGKEFTRFVKDLIHQLDGKSLSSKCEENLDHHVDMCAPLREPIIATGIMLARPSNGIRIHSYMNLVRDPYALEDRLKKMKYPYPCKELIDFLAKFPQQALNNIGLALDIGEEIGPKVGIEIFPEEGKNTKEIWEPLLALLVREKLASAQKVEACLKWPGGLLQRQEPELDILCTRKINHIKLVFLPGKKILAKIYLVFQQKEFVNLSKNVEK